jgi:hypothetical protein
VISAGKKKEQSSTFPLRLQWLIEWQGMYGPINFYPFMFGVISYFLLLLLPDNLLTLYPALKHFTAFMSGVVLAISAFSDNVPQESVRFVSALSWALLPFWIPFYEFWRVRKKDQEVFKNIQDIIKNSRYPIRTQLRLMLLMPFVLIAGIWMVWTGYAFEGGEPSIAKPFTYTNNFFIVIWNYIFTQGFLLSIVALLFIVRFYPSLLKLYFSKNSKY